MAKGAENVYTCRKCKAQLVTIDRDEGVTPFMMRCGSYNPNGCGGDMTSAFYPKGPRPSHIPAPTHEWYAPDEQERKRYRKQPGMLDHINNGGLLIRAILPPATPQPTEARE